MTVAICVSFFYCLFRVPHWVESHALQSGSQTLGRRRRRLRGVSGKNAWTAETDKEQQQRWRRQQPEQLQTAAEQIRPDRPLWRGLARRAGHGGVRPHHIRPPPNGGCRFRFHRRFGGHPRVGWSSHHSRHRRQRFGQADGSNCHNAAAAAAICGAGMDHIRRPCGGTEPSVLYGQLFGAAPVAGAACIIISYSFFSPRLMWLSSLQQKMSMTFNCFYKEIFVLDTARPWEGCEQPKIS